MESVGRELLRPRLEVEPEMPRARMCAEHRGEFVVELPRTQSQRLRERRRQHRKSLKRWQAEEHRQGVR